MEILSSVTVCYMALKTITYRNFLIVYTPNLYLNITYSFLTPIKKQIQEINDNVMLIALVRSAVSRAVIKLKKNGLLEAVKPGYPNPHIIHFEEKMRTKPIKNHLSESHNF